jgi:hypothetical protein
MLDELTTTQHYAADANASSTAEAETLRLRLRSLHLLHARWQAGTLFSPTAEETAILLEQEYPLLPAQMCGMFLYITPHGSRRLVHTSRHFVHVLGATYRRMLKHRARAWCGRRRLDAAIGAALARLLSQRARFAVRSQVVGEIILFVWIQVTHQIDDIIYQKHRVVVPRQKPLEIHALVRVTQLSSVPIFTRIIPTNLGHVRRFKPHLVS